MKTVMSKLNDLRTWALTRPWVIALLFAPFFKPGDILNAYLVLNWAVIIWKGLAVLVIGACFLAKPRLSVMTVLLCAYQVLCAVITEYQRDFNWIRWMYSVVNIAALCVLLDEAVDADPRALVRGLTCCLGALCLANLATVLLFPGGMEYMHRPEFYLLGLDNSHSFYIIPLLTVLVLAMYNARRGLLFQIAMLALFTMSIYITWAASGVVAVTAFLALFLFYRVRKSYRLVNVCTCYAGVAAVFLVVVLMQATNSFSLLLRLLHKDVTLSGRLQVWRAAITLIKVRPQLGFGLCTYEQMRKLVGEINCHNLFLQTMFESGVVGTTLLLVTLALMIRPLMRMRKSFGGYMLTAGLFSFLLVLQAEALVLSHPFYTVCMLCYYAEKTVPALEPEGGGAQTLSP